MGEAGELLMQQALDTMRQLHDAEAAGLHYNELKRLQLLASSLCRTVIDFHLVTAGHSPSTSL